MKKYKRLTNKIRFRIINEVKMMFFAHRDCLFNKFKHAPSVNFDPRDVPKDIMDGYYGEMFGIMRGVELLGYGYFGSSNLDAEQEGKSDDPCHNLRWWLGYLIDECLREEDWQKSSKENCMRLLEHYRKLVKEGKE